MKPTLIVLDDDLPIAEIVSKIAKINGFECTITTKVNNLLTEIANKNYDVIVMDLCMPDKDGLELITELGKNKNCSDLIIMSGAQNYLLDAANLLAKAQGLNVIGILSKPFSVDELSFILKKSLL